MSSTDQAAKDRDILQRELAQAGLHNVANQHLPQAAKAWDAAQRMRSRIPRNLPMSIEPAHTFRASREV